MSNYIASLVDGLLMPGNLAIYSTIVGSTFVATVSLWKLLDKVTTKK